MGMKLFFRGDSVSGEYYLINRKYLTPRMHHFELEIAEVAERYFACDVHARLRLIDAD